MSDERLKQLRPFPNFKLHELPEIERAEADSIKSNIGDMHERSTSFWAGRSLFQSCAERQVFDPAHAATYHKWQLCAARDGAMSVYHFGRIIEGIDESLAHCPTLREKIDGRAKREARKQFERRFPSYITLRNALAHSAERSKTAKASQRHGKLRARTIEINPMSTVRLGKNASMFILLDNIYGTTFSSMWEGKIIRCDISDQSGVWLDETIDSYWAAFDAIIDPNPEPPPTITFSSEPTPGLG